MLSRETEQRLVEIFITISLGDEKINKLKQNILSNNNINPIQIFFKLDLNNVGYLSKSDFFSFLKYFSVNFTQTDIDYIFYFYDKDNDNALNFNEFLDLIVSDSNYFYKKSFKKKFKKNRFDMDELNGNLELGIEKKILEILLEEIELARQLDELIINIKQCNDFEIQNIFYEIKSYSYVTSDSLKAFFDRNEVNYNDKFIKNIFNRFNTKDIIGKISFEKFKSFFNLSTNNNMMSQISQFPGNQIISNLGQTFASNDIKFSQTDNNINNNNGFICSDNSNNNINPYYSNNYCYHNIKNENYINEEDIQFECSHLSRSGSFDSYRNKLEKSNCKYVSKNTKRNNLYKNYLREKRSKSLEKSLSKSICRTNEAISRTDKRTIFDKNIRNIRVVKDDDYEYNEYNTNKEGNNLSNSGGSFHEDLPINLPIRLDKNLVKRPLPKRNNYSFNRFHFCYDNHFEDLNIKHLEESNKENENYISNYYMPYNKNINKKRDIDYNSGLNNLDLKVYQEDMSSQINNGRY